MDMGHLRPLRLAVAMVAIAFPAAACGDDGNGAASTRSSSSSFGVPLKDAEVYPVLASSEVVVGRNRLVFGLLDENDAPIGSPRIDVGIRFFDLSSDEPEPAGGADTHFVWSVEGERGVYVTDASFEHEGQWGAEVTIHGNEVDETVRISFDVAARPQSVPVGEAPPPSDTPTVDEVTKLSEITTDPHPDPAFYRLSIAEALEAKRPLVVVFATPEFCSSAVCGPTLDIVQSVADDFPDVNFIHVEVFENLDDPSNLKPVPAVREWGLPSEPWVFVVGADDKVTAKYEGVVGAGELRDHLSTLR